MPVIRNIRLSLKTNELLRRQGIREYSRLRPEIKSLIREVLASMRSERLLEPAIAYEIYSIREVRDAQVFLEGNVALDGRMLASLLAKAEELVAVVCTIGPRLENRVTEYFGQEEPVRGLLLDGVGSAAVDSLIQEICKLMMREAPSRGYQASSPLGPGMSGFPISEQWPLFQLVPAQEIGVRLTPSGVMLPQKSASMVIGLGPQMATWTQAEGCARCNLRKTCLYKVQA